MRGNQIFCSGVPTPLNLGTCKWLLFTLRRSRLDVWAGEHHFSLSDFPNGLSWEAAPGIINLNIFNLIVFAILCFNQRSAVAAQLLRWVSFLDRHHFRDTMDPLLEVS